MTERPNLFEEEDLDVSDFAPKTGAEPQADKDKLRQAGEASGFRSRPVHRVPHRYRTGRTAQFNTRIMPTAFDRFYQIAGEQGWKIGETVERALEEKLGQGR